MSTTEAQDAQGTQDIWPTEQDAREVSEHWHWLTIYFFTFVGYVLGLSLCLVMGPRLALYVLGKCPGTSTHAQHHVKLGIYDFVQPTVVISAILFYLRSTQT